MFIAHVIYSKTYLFLNKLHALLYYDAVVLQKIVALFPEALTAVCYVLCV